MNVLFYKRSFLGITLSLSVESNFTTLWHSCYCELRGVTEWAAQVWKVYINTELCIHKLINTGMQGGYNRLISILHFPVHSMIGSECVKPSVWIEDDSHRRTNRKIDVTFSIILEWQENIFPDQQRDILFTSTGFTRMICFESDL